METEAPTPRVHLGEVVLALTPGRAWFCRESGMSLARFDNLNREPPRGEWRRDEIENGLAALHRLGTTLRNLSWSDVVDAGAEVLPAGLPQRRHRGPRAKK